MQHLGALAVGEVHAGELDRALDRRQRLGARLVAQLGLGVHHVEDLVERRAGSQERVEELRERLDGIEEVRQEEHEREQRPDRDRVVEVERAAVAEHDRRRDCAEQADEREVPGVQVDGAQVRPAVGVADLAEALGVGALAPEGLHDARAREILGQRRRHVAQALAHPPVGARRVPAEEPCRERHQREEDERRQREAPVEVDQDGRRAEQEQRVLDARIEPVGDEVLERVDVVGQARDQPAGAVALEVAELERLDVLEEVAPQIGEDALPDPGREVGLRHRGAPAEQRGDDEGQRPEDELAAIARHDAAVDRELRGQRGQQADGRPGEQRGHREDRLGAVGTHERQQAAHAAERAAPREPRALGRQHARWAHRADAHGSTSAGASSSSETNVRSTSPWRQISA